MHGVAKVALFSQEALLIHKAMVNILDIVFHS
jgi:hypothetical protein